MSGKQHVSLSIRQLISLTIKICFLPAMVGLVYVSDLLDLWAAVFSINMLPRVFIAISLVLAIMYQNRRVVKTLILHFSEKKYTIGLLPLLFALVTYMAGSYIGNKLWLHLFSILLFSMAYAFFMLDYRIPILMFIPSALILVMVPSPLELVFPQIKVAGLPIDYIIVVIASICYLVWELFRSKLEPVECTFCKNGGTKDNISCPSCGKIVSMLAMRLTWRDLLVILLLMVIASTSIAVSGLAIPILSYEAENPTLTIHQIQGKEVQPIIAPHGWNLKDSERLTEDEQKYSEELIFLNAYTSAENRETEVFVIIEMSRNYPYIASHIRSIYTIGWERIYEENIELPEEISGYNTVVQRGNTTLVILSWAFRSFFQEGVNFTSRYIGVSAYMNVSEPLGNERALELSNVLINMSTEILDTWIPARQWTSFASFFYGMTNQLLIFRDFYIVIVSGLGLFLGAYRARKKDKEKMELYELISNLSYNEKALVQAGLSARKKYFTGYELFDLAQSLPSMKSDNPNLSSLQFLLVSNKVESTSLLLEHISSLGLFERKYKFMRQGVFVVWEPMF